MRWRWTYSPSWLTSRRGQTSGSRWLLGIAVLALFIAPAANATPATPQQLESALTTAQAYWGRSPQECATPTITYEALPPTPRGEVLGQAWWGYCRIGLNATEVEWSAEPILLCIVVTHEYGHLVLGPTYFAATNPTEPEHSPDPRNIMYHDVPLAFPPCEPLGATAEGSFARERSLRYVLMADHCYTGFERHRPTKRCLRWYDELKHLDAQSA